MKRLVFLLSVIASSNVSAQNLEKMQWFNAPKKWSIENQSLSMFVTPKTDFWRVTQYGFTVDDGPFYYALQGGEFEVKVKITGEYRARYDHMGLMLRVDQKRWIKTGLEYVNEKINISTVVTNGKSDWSVIELKDIPKSMWIKAVRRLDSVELSYSFDDKVYTTMRQCWFPDNVPVMAGMAAASPDGDGFNALFEGFAITHLPDARRLEWLEKNKY
jgi:uncharacterized protein